MQVLCLRLCAIRFLWTFPQGRSFRAFLGSCVSSVQTKFGGHFRQSVDVRKLKIARKGQLEKCGQLGFAEDIVREQEKRLSKASEFRAEANRRRNPSPASKRQEDPEGVELWDSEDEDEMLEQSEDEVRSWRIGLREEGSASGKVPNVQDTEQAEMILERSTNTSHAEEVVDLVASSSSQCVEWSEERVSCAENVLKQRKDTGFSEKFEDLELPKIEKCGVARAVEPIRAELPSNLSECESARALEPVHSRRSSHAKDGGEISLTLQSETPLSSRIRFLSPCRCGCAGISPQRHNSKKVKFTFPLPRQVTCSELRGRLQVVVRNQSAARGDRRVTLAAE